MVRDFHIGDEATIGYYVSLITTAFAVSQVISAIPLGMISDRLGRRPVALAGLAIGILSVLSFGLAKTYAWAITTKILSGLLDNNVAIIKSMVSELSMGYSETQRARAFSLLQVVYGLGGIVGASLGGYLSEPVRKYPNLFGNAGQVTDFLTEYPYFLPCFAAAIIDIVCWIAGYLYLEETLVVECPTEPSEETPLLDDGASAAVTRTLSFSDALSPAVVAICLTYSMLAYQTVFNDELFPTWSATRPEDGGLGLGSSEIGGLLSFCGLVTLFVQTFVNHRLTHWLGTIPLFQSSLFFLIFLFATQGSARYLYDIPNWDGEQTKVWLFAGLLLQLGLKAMLQTLAMTCAIILVNNAATRPNTLATINALSQCCSSAARALGPASSGFIWSSTIAALWLPFTVRAHLSWVVLSCIAAVTFIMSLRLKPSLYSPKPQ
ncbi:major facilitator superfamily domain-containing protein [Dichotomocladium elegans]|nr:major facilitator superfamily domain-containing protein [Dichotomocladium elegans]